MYSDLPGGIDFLLNNYLPDSQQIDVLFKLMVESESSNELAGFQFNVTGATVTGVSGGVAEEAGFMLTASTTTILGFSLLGDTISVGDAPNVLVTLSLDDVSNEICLTNIILAGRGGDTIQANGRGCFSIR